MRATPIFDQLRAEHARADAIYGFDPAPSTSDQIVLIDKTGAPDVDWAEMLKTMLTWVNPVLPPVEEFDKQWSDYLGFQDPNGARRLLQTDSPYWSVGELSHRERVGSFARLAKQILKDEDLCITVNQWYPSNEPQEAIVIDNDIDAAHGEYDEPKPAPEPTPEGAYMSTERVNYLRVNPREASDDEIRRGLNASAEFLRLERAREVKKGFEFGTSVRSAEEVHNYAINDAKKALNTAQKDAAQKIGEMNDELAEQERVNDVAKAELERANKVREEFRIAIGEKDWDRVRELRKADLERTGGKATAPVSFVQPANDKVSAVSASFPDGTKEEFLEQWSDKPYSYRGPGIKTGDRIGAVVDGETLIGTATVDGDQVTIDKPVAQAMQEQLSDIQTKLLSRLDGILDPDLYEKAKAKGELVDDVPKPKLNIPDGPPLAHDGIKWQTGSKSTNTAKTVEQSVLDDAGTTISGGRVDDYGKAEDSFATIAKLWSTYLTARARTIVDLEFDSEVDEYIDSLEVTIDGRDVAQLMVLLKTARDAISRKRDNLVDGAGYLALAERSTRSDR